MVFDRKFVKKSIIQRQYKSNSRNLHPELDDLVTTFWNKLKEKRTFHEVQQRIIDAYFKDKKKQIFLRMGRKGTKTATNITIAWGQSISVPKSTTYIILPTITQALDIYWDEKRLQWCDIGDPELNELFVSQIDNSKNTVHFINGSMIKILGTWTEARSKGTQPNLVIADEVQDCKAEYLDGMEPNLAAKEDTRLIMSGTPPRKRNHYHEWEERIRKSKNGITFHYSSYVNTSLPHLKQWLDEKKVELFQAGKEDIWYREYLAEDYFSSDERVIPDISLTDHQKILSILMRSPSSYQPIVAISVTQNFICYTIGFVWYSRTEGSQFWILESDIKKRIFDKSYEMISQDVKKKTDTYADYFQKKWRTVVNDQTDSYSHIIKNVTNNRKDFKSKVRGIPLLKEMILNEKIIFSTKIDQAAVEAQNLLKGDDLDDFPILGTLAMLANEYYQPSSLSTHEKAAWDKLSPLREAGLICNLPKTKGKRILNFNWD